MDGYIVQFYVLHSYHLILHLYCIYHTSKYGGRGWRDKRNLEGLFLIAGHLQFDLYCHLVSQ